MQRSLNIIGDQPMHHTAEIEADRDRFAALAMCASDILLELNRDLTIVFTYGDTARWTGSNSPALIGKSVLDVIAPQDQLMMREALAAAARGIPISNIIAHLDGPLGLRTAFSVFGVQLADRDGHYFLSLRSDAFTVLFGEGDPRRFVPDGKSGLPNSRSFAALVGGRMKALPSGTVCLMSLIRLDGFATLNKRLDPIGRQSFAETIGASLRACALQGELAGQFDHESYGVIHAKSLDLADMLDHLTALSVKADPKGEGVRFQTATVEMDVAEMGESEQVKSLLYIINRFTDFGPAEFSIASLSAGLSDMVGATIHRLMEFRSVITAGNFDIAFQPIVDLETRRIHHYEMLARFTSFGERLSTYDAITFAEQTGLICEFDLAMCEKVLKWLQAHGAGPNQAPLAVNVSGNSIGTPTFVKAMHDLLQRYQDVRHLIMFEITELARITDLRSVNDVVRGLRLAGHKVCLDDFGAGAAAFQYLRALDVDVVKIDGIYVRDGLKSSKGAAFLKAMATLCTDLGIEVVAEMVEDNASVAFLRQCGVTYGQGYLFGRPSLDIADFKDAAEPSASHETAIPARQGGNSRDVVGER